MPTSGLLQVAERRRKYRATSPGGWGGGLHEASEKEAPEKDLELPLPVSSQNP